MSEPRRPSVQSGSTEKGERQEALSAVDGYRLWAATYERETVVSALEERIVRSMHGGEPRGSLLDAGCGTGRRLAAATSATGVGIDRVSRMLLVGRTARPTLRVAVADVRHLPFRDGAFDTLWCRLVLGHLPDPGLAFRELGRVARKNAALIVSDFHPAAIRAGHERTFRDPDGAVRTIEHHVRTPERYEREATRWGWRLDERIEAPAGRPERSFYEITDRIEQFERERDLPLVLVMCFRR